MAEASYIQIERLLHGVDCVLACETAADYLGIDDMASERLWHTVYSREQLDIADVKCIIVEDYDALEIVEVRDMRCTSARQTIIDLMRNDRDDEVILQSLSWWYEEHNHSFNDLLLPEDVVSIFEDYKDDAIHYYDN